MKIKPITPRDSASSFPEKVKPATKPNKNRPILSVFKKLLSLISPEDSYTRLNQDQPQCMQRMSKNIIKAGLARNPEKALVAAALFMGRSYPQSQTYFRDLQGSD